uniref:Uncharacterized protein n=1 Tax=Meloidogyne enterolobii TaxID=390850 RepID=A0A6V7U0E1_MELEN|nr:unnamed protein product [Meloidogyne enterolobii]
MENSSSIIPRLEMESLQQMEQENDNNSLFNIRDVDAQRFLEESLVLLLNFNNLQQNNSSQKLKNNLIEKKKN